MPPALFNKFGAGLVLAWVIGADTTAAQTTPGSGTLPPPAAVITSTRLVQTYHGLEQQLLQAQAQKQDAQVLTWVGSLFQVRTYDGRFLDRNAWLKEPLPAQAARWILTDLAVQTHETLDFVSYERLDPRTLRKQSIVDVWQSASPPQLLLRFETPWRLQGQQPVQVLPRPDGKG